MVYVRLADRSTRGVPAWMFDPGVCAGVKLEERPRIACRALAELSLLLEEHQATARSGGHEPVRKPSKNETPGER